MFKRLGHNQQSPDFFLLDLCSKQDSTLKEVFPKPQPAPSPSREQPKSPVSEEGGDSGVHSKVGANSPTDEVDIHPSKDDLAMLGYASGGADNNLSHSSQEGDSTDPDSQRRRIVVESVDGSPNGSAASCRASEARCGSTGDRPASNGGTRTSPRTLRSSSPTNQVSITLGYIDWIAVS